MEKKQLNQFLKTATFLIFIIIATFYLVWFQWSDEIGSLGKLFAYKTDWKQNHSRIFFMETSETGTIKLRHLIGIESAAKWNPMKEIQVYVYINDTGSPDQVMKSLSDTYPNIKYRFPKMEEYVRDSVLEEWYRKGVWRRSASPTAHSSDGLRILEMWRNGGIYLDLDIITLKIMNFPQNAVVPESDIFMANEFLAFQKHHPLMKSTVDAFVKEYNPNTFVANGPPLFGKELKKYCGDLINHTCDIVVLPVEAICPIPLEDGQQLFNESVGETTLLKLENSIGVHWWNDIFHDEPVNASSRSAFMTLTKRNAPVVYEEIRRRGQL